MVSKRVSVGSTTGIRNRNLKVCLRVARRKRDDVLAMAGVLNSSGMEYLGKTYWINGIISERGSLFV